MESSLIAALQLLFAVAVYPGLLFLVVLAIVIGRLLGGPGTGGRALGGLRGALRGEVSPALAGAALLALLALTRLPWPRPHWEPRAGVDVWILWALLEASALLALVPAWLSGEPIAGRAATRAAQLGASGRLPLWIAVAVAASLPDVPAPVERVGVGLALLSALLALPAAAGWPPLHHDPFGVGRVAATGSAEALALSAWTRRLWSIFWLALLATVFVPLPPLAWYGELLMRVAVVAGLALIVTGVDGLLVNRTLPAALRWCWWLALPCALAAVLLQR